MVQRVAAGARVTEWVFRHCLPEHTDLRATLVGTRESDDGGRFHVQGEFGAVYVASEISTALAELDQKAARLGLARAELLPRVLLTLEISAQRVLDLTDGSIRDAWGLTEADLAGEEYARCREVARAARDDGFEAIRYPSARGSSPNYAVFYDRLRPGSHLVEHARDWVDGIAPAGSG